MINFKFKTKTASLEDIFLHLKECNSNFIPPLEQKVNIREYSKKIFEKTVTFESWENKTLVGLIAAYFNDPENKIGYITSVSVVKEYYGKKIAFELMNKCISYARKNKFNEIILEVSEENDAAIRLYKKLNFTPFENENNVMKMKFHI